MNIQSYNPRAKNQTGIISGEPGDVYHANPAISNSDLSLFLTDPKRFEAIRKGEIEQKETPSLHFGDVFHTRCLESIKVFQKRFVLDSYVEPKPTKKQCESHANFICKYKASLNMEKDSVVYEKEPIKKPTKPQIEAFINQDKLIRRYDNFWKVHKGKKVCSNDDLKHANAMRDAIFSDADAAPLLENFDGMCKELTLRTEELEHGFCVQSKLDLYDEMKNVAIDLKTVANLDLFKRNFVKFGYYRQAAFYTLVANLLLDREIERFYFIAVESETPHEVAVFETSPHSISQGIREIRTGLESLGNALESNRFSKRYPGIQQLDLEKWDDERIESRLERMAKEVAA